MIERKKLGENDSGEKTVIRLYNQLMKNIRSDFFK